MDKKIKYAIIIVVLIFLLLFIVALFKYPESKKIIETNLSNACFSYSGKKELTITGYSSKCSKDVVIPSKIENKNISKIGSYAFRGLEITSISIPDSVVTIDDFAFLENNLKEINLPKNLKEIGYGAFEENKLKNVIIPDNVEKIEHYAFYKNELESFEIGSSVKEINLFALSENPNLKIVKVNQKEGELDLSAMGTKAQIVYSSY